MSAVDHAPAADAVAGPSFPPLLKALTLGFVGALAVVGAASWPELRAAALGPAPLGFLLALAAVVAAGAWGVLTSRTAIDDTHVRLHGLWTREVRLAEITQVKLIRLPGLAWLIVPRLVVRTGGIGVATFPAADPRVVAAFHRLAYGHAPLPIADAARLHGPTPTP